jgi:acylglycerol lipase
VTRARLGALGLLLIAAACAPRIEGAGPPVALPAMTDDRIVAADGFVLPLRRWSPAREPAAVLLALHGFNDHATAFERPASAWAERGILTYAYDQRGFGRTGIRGLWAGADTMAADLRAALGLLRARHPGIPLYLLGESMGGAVALVAMAGPDAPAVDGLALVAPAVRGRAAMWPWERGLLWLLAHTVPALQVTGEGLVTPSDNIEMLRGLGRDPLVIKHTRVDAVWGLVNLMDRALAAAPALDVPALLLYGATDELIPPPAMLALLGRLPAARTRVAFYDSGYHMVLRDLGADVAIDDLAGWLRDPSRALASGAEDRGRAWRARYPDG